MEMKIEIFTENTAFGTTTTLSSGPISFLSLDLTRTRDAGIDQYDKKRLLTRLTQACLHFILLFSSLHRTHSFALFSHAMLQHFMTKTT